jgi:hypothetical protein
MEMFRLHLHLPSAILQPAEPCKNSGYLRRQSSSNHHDLGLYSLPRTHLDHHASNPIKAFLTLARSSSQPITRASPAVH